MRITLNVVSGGRVERDSCKLKNETKMRSWKEFSLKKERAFIGLCCSSAAIGCGNRPDSVKLTPENFSERRCEPPWTLRGSRKANGVRSSDHNRRNMTDVSPEMPEMSLAEEIIYQNKGIQFLESIHAMANLDSE